jgi:hypothetical protein
MNLIFTPVAFTLPRDYDEPPVSLVTRPVSLADAERYIAHVNEREHPFYADAHLKLVPA